MAPRKAKADASAPGGGDDTAMVLAYLLEQNRPYSATDISTNLHAKVSKAQAIKILAKLADKGDLTARTAGKQIVYHTPQKSDSTSPETITLIKSETEDLSSQLSALKAEEKKVRACLSALLSKPRISELRDDILRLEGERVELQACLDKLNGEDTATATATSGAGAVDISLSPEERAHLEHEWKTWHRQATLRQRICGDMWDRCSEVLPENTSLAELWESLGLEGALQ